MSCDKMRAAAERSPAVWGFGGATGRRRGRRKDRLHERAEPSDNTGSCPSVAWRIPDQGEKTGADTPVTSASAPQRFPGRGRSWRRVDILRFIDTNNPDIAARLAALALARMKLCHMGRRNRHGHPSGDGPGMFSCLRIIGDARKTPAHLNDR